jgi:hypothetical protein
MKSNIHTPLPDPISHHCLVYHHHIKCAGRFNRADLARIVRVLNFPGLLSILHVGSRPILILRIKTQANVYMYLAIKSNTYVEKTQLFGSKGWMLHAHL